jgi:hypothetical protein
MSRLDDLPPDQHAALSLLLSQRKSYAEVAALLGIAERAVHDRAQAALAVLAPLKARELTAERREDVGDYLLGQQTSVAERLATRTYLDGSAPARDWANAISAELEPLSTAPLPEVPPGAAPAPDGPDPDTEPSRQGSPDQGVTHRGGALPSSRLGGAILLAVIAAVAIVAVVLLAGGGSTSSHSRNTTATTGVSAGSSAGTTSTAPKGSSGASGPSENARLALTSPDPSSKAVGVVAILAESGKHAFYLAAEHLPPSSGFFYAVWLYNSPASFVALSKSPPVGSKGTLQGGALLPANAAQYHTMLLTRETNNRPTHPGPIVLRGAFNLGH